MAAFPQAGFWQVKPSRAVVVSVASVMPDDDDDLIEFL